MAIDRDAALKKAEKLLRQGKLDGAIQEYVRLVEDQPRDWNTINALGDLYARAGNAERAVAQFARIADHLHDEGFFAKAAALYKKALKTKGDHEPSLLRLAEITTRQGLVADAKLYWTQLSRLRRARGDERGADECVVALGALADPELKLAAGRAAQALGDTAAASELFLEAAEIFEKNGRQTQALDALVAAARLNEGDARLRADAATRCLAAGDVDRARLFLSRESAGDDPDLLLALGRMEIGGGDYEGARRAFSRMLLVAPDRTADVMGVAEELAAAGHHDAAFGVVDAVTETALLAGDLDAAIHALHAFLAHVAHVPALMKLVEVAVDAGRDELMIEAQERLADAYLDAGRGADARVVAEDLVTRDPGRPGNVDRLRRALIQAGVEDVEAIVSSRLEPPVAVENGMILDLPDLESVPGTGDEEQPPIAAEEVTVHREIVLDDPPLDIAPSGTDALAPDVAVPVAARDGRPPAEAPPEEEDAGIETMEIDLSDALAQLASESPVFAPPPAALPVPPARPGEPGTHASARAEPASEPQDLDAVFEQIRMRVREDQGPAPAAQLERGLRLLEEGRIDEAVTDLTAAARAPMLRFSAAAALGRLYASRRELESAVEWLERAAEAPAASEDETLAVLYDLAGVLERMGESARALAVFIEIDADQAAYRDVPARIEQLTRTRTGSRGL